MKHKSFYNSSRDQNQYKKVVSIETSFSTILIVLKDNLLLINQVNFLILIERYGLKLIKEQFDLFKSVLLA